jgi:cobyrinic acid a,c-diamide synthase
MSGVVIAGTASGVGKTTVALGLMQAFKKRGLRVQPFKVGPDFIDPGYHTLMCGLPSRNLDTWMLSPAKVQETFAKHASRSDIAVVEGVMGLFDGVNGRSEEGSTAHIAKLLNIPVILVVDARSMARSVGAVVYGFEQYDPKLKVAGVIFNRVGSPRHYDYLREAVADRCASRVFGYLPRQEALQMPERHLGLVTAGEIGLTENFMENLSYTMESFVNIDEVINTIGGYRERPDSGMVDRGQEINLGGSIASGVRLAVAQDEAFSFYYPDNLELLAELGVEICPFSPMKDLSLPQADGIYLGGGYPEVYAERLSANQSMRHQIRKAAETGMPIYAECGGLMYLTRAIWDLDGKSHDMVGLFPADARMLKKRKALGYVEVCLMRDCLLGQTGWRVRGHEYHYSELTEDLLQQAVEGAYELWSPKNQDSRREGYAYRNVLASYVHLHFGSNPKVAEAMVDHMRQWRGNR